MAWGVECGRRVRFLRDIGNDKAYLRTDSDEGDDGEGD